VTADHHLTSRDEHPERFQTLEKLLRNVLDTGITHLVIAGDCFDKGRSNYSEWDHIIRQTEFQSLTIHLIPGNHDVQIKQSHFASSNVHVYSQPELTQLGDLMSMPILFLPYRHDCTMGDILAEFQTHLEPQKWILIGHGDWSDGLKTLNPHEPGIYMPLSRSDVTIYQPRRIILGHIHKPLDSDPVHYPGSPCPLDITETGRRRYLVIDTETGETAPSIVDSELLFFNETLMILPGLNELNRMKEEIQKRIANWDIQSHERDKCRIRIKVRGFTSDKEKLTGMIRESFKSFRFYKDEGLDDSELFFADDAELNKIAQLSIQAVDRLNFTPGPYDPGRDEMMLQALKTVYGED
ncbi:metallophosphoesterase, partial [bacterium]|nr:metallophosphoesterase [bacterium]